MIDAPIEMAISPYWDIPVAAGGFEGEMPMDGGGSGGGVDYLVDRNHYYELASHMRAIQSNGYIVIDYDGDNLYDQAWIGAGGFWLTSYGGGIWVADDGPYEELLSLWARGFTL